MLQGRPNRIAWMYLTEQVECAGQDFPGFVYAESHRPRAKLTLESVVWRDALGPRFRQDRHPARTGRCDLFADVQMNEEQA